MNERYFFSPQVAHAWGAFLVGCALAVAPGLSAQSPSPVPSPMLDPKLSRQIDQAARDILKKSGAPSVSIAIVKDGAVAYLHAYGSANLESKTAAASEMRYSIGCFCLT